MAKVRNGSEADLVVSFETTAWLNGITAAESASAIDKVRNRLRIISPLLYIKRYDLPNHYTIYHTRQA